MDDAVLFNVKNLPGATRRNRLLALYLSLPRSERDRLFAATERAAESIGVSRRTIERWVVAGVVRAIHVGRNYRVFPPSLEEYLARGDNVCL